MTTTLDHLLAEASSCHHDFLVAIRHYLLAAPFSPEESEWLTAMEEAHKRSEAAHDAYLEACRDEETL